MKSVLHVHTMNRRYFYVLCIQRVPRAKQEYDNQTEYNKAVVPVKVQVIQIAKLCAVHGDVLGVSRQLPKWC